MKKKYLLLSWADFHHKLFNHLGPDLGMEVSFKDVMEPTPKTVFYAHLTPEEVIVLSEHYDVMIQGTSKSIAEDRLWLDVKGKRFSVR